MKHTPTKSSAVKTEGKTVWNAKVGCFFRFSLYKSSTAFIVSFHCLSSLVLFPILLKAFCSCVMCFSVVQMILMSGLSRTALEDLASDKLFEDRIPHICNILKFAVLKKIIR